MIRLTHLNDVVVLAELVVVRVGLAQVSCQLFQGAPNRHHHCHCIRLQQINIKSFLWIRTVLVSL